MSKILCLCLSCTAAFAAEPRELSTDRPDQTESPFTVPAGRWQVEMDLAKGSIERGGKELWNFGGTNLKYGLCDSADLQFVLDGWSHESGGSTRFGDLTLRLKVNLWGNDGGRTAAAVMPFLTVPLHSESEWAGGIILPLAVDLGGGWGLGVMTELDVMPDEAGGGHHVEWLNSVTLSRDLTDKLGAYVELVGVLSAEDGADWLAQFDCGFTYALSGDVQLDAGCNFGLTDSAPDFEPFVGISLRF